jgi:hypothetical protein
MRKVLGCCMFHTFYSAPIDTLIYKGTGLCAKLPNATTKISKTILHGLSPDYIFMVDHAEPWILVAVPTVFPTVESVVPVDQLTGPSV